MRYLSVCSGIEAATAAWHHMGWQPAAFSEIEPFPSAVLAHHYPNVPNVGDMTKYEDWNVGQIDLLVGGTPCQAFSVAGLRGGLSDARGNLSLVFCKMADHFDPEFVLWENVPGVLSSTDNAFGCFLAGLCGSGDPLTPGRKWSNAGVVSGPKRTVAWRVLDAQFFGVAQRRRRVFVLAVRGAGNWAAARALFPVGEGVFWNSAPSRKAREDVTGTLEASIGSSRGAGTPTAALTACQNGVSLSNQEIFGQRGAYLAPQVTVCRMVAFGEYSDDGTASTTKARDYKDATDLVAVSFKVPVAYGVGEQPDVGHCLRSGASKADKHESTTYVAQPIGFNARQDPDSWANRSGPLDTDGGTQTVAFGGDIARTLQARHDSSPCADRGMDVVATAMQVRRLTPVECERLQGFPDNFTAIPWRKAEAADCPDGPRYKALGNSMAVPVMRWLGERIQGVQQ